MRHRKKGKKLGRSTSHRKALIRNLANQVIENKEIRTTTAKAKAARSKIDRLITYAKKGSLHHRRLAFAFLRSKNSVNILFDEIGPMHVARQGGYTRVVKLGRRAGDGAHISLLQLVGFEKLGTDRKTEKKTSAKKKVKEAEVKESIVESTTEESSSTRTDAQDNRESSGENDSQNKQNE